MMHACFACNAMLRLLTDRSQLHLIIAHGGCARAVEKKTDPFRQEKVAPDS